MVHGLQGGKTTCFPPQRAYIPHLDDGCTSDSFRCIVTYSPPTFPTCVCDYYVNQAYKDMPNGICQKNDATGARVCYPRNYEGDKQIGGWEYFGCPEDSCAAPARPRHTLYAHIVTHSRRGAPTHTA